MENLPFLNDSNFYEIVDKVNFSSVEDIISTLNDFIDYAPFMSRIISLFMVECMKNNILFEDAFRKRIELKSGNPEIDLSRCIYATYLGAFTNLKNIQIISSIFETVKVECNEINNFGGKIEIFYSLTILKKLSFNLRDCVARLSVLPLDCVLDAIIMDQSLFAMSVLIQMCKYVDFLEILKYKIDQIKLKKEIIACIFINYSSEQDKHNSEDFRISNTGEKRKELMRGLIQGEVLDYCLKVANKELLSILLKRNFNDPVLSKISLEVFQGMSFNSKNEFFEAFLKLTSPSISHFLSYLEQFKTHFKLNEQEQIDFVALLKAFHCENTGYLSVVIPKLVAFGIVKNENVN